MSIRRGSSGWEDLEKQSRHLILEIDAGATSGAYDFEQFDTLDPTGGLDRNEIAELVALERQVVAVPNGTAGGDNSRGTFMVENTFSPSPQLVSADSKETTNDVEGVTGIHRSIGQEEADPDTVDHYRLDVNSGFEDDTNGNGGQPSPETLTQTINFREMFGTGPTVDRHDVLYTHIREAFTDGSYHFTENTNWYWDIQEEE